MNKLNKIKNLYKRVESCKDDYNFFLNVGSYVKNIIDDQELVEYVNKLEKEWIQSRNKYDNLEVKTLEELKQTEIKLKKIIKNKKLEDFKKIKEVFFDLESFHEGLLKSYGNTKPEFLLKKYYKIAEMISKEGYSGELKIFIKEKNPKFICGNLVFSDSYKPFIKEKEALEIRSGIYVFNDWRYLLRLYKVIYERQKLEQEEKDFRKKDIMYISNMYTIEQELLTMKKISEGYNDLDTRLPIKILVRETYLNYLLKVNDYFKNELESKHAIFKTNDNNSDNKSGSIIEEAQRYQHKDLERRLREWENRKEFKRRRILKETRDPKLHAIDILIEFFESRRNKDTKNLVIDYHNFNYESTMEASRIFEGFLEKLQEEKIFDSYKSENYTRGTKYIFFDVKFKKLLNYRKIFITGIKDSNFKSKKDKNKNKSTPQVKFEGGLLIWKEIEVPFKRGEGRVMTTLFKDKREFRAQGLKPFVKGESWNLSALQAIGRYNDGNRDFLNKIRRKLKKFNKGGIKVELNQDKGVGKYILEVRYPKK